MPRKQMIDLATESKYKLFVANFRRKNQQWAQHQRPGIVSGNEQYLAHKRRQQKVNYLWPFLGMGGAMLSFCQWHVKMGQVFLPIGTRWWNNQIEAVNCSLSRTFKLFPHTVSPSFTSTASAPPFLHPHISFASSLVSVSGCGDTLQLLQCLLNYGGVLEATALMKHAAREPHFAAARGDVLLQRELFSPKISQRPSRQGVATRSHLPPLARHSLHFLCQRVDTNRRTVGCCKNGCLPPRWEATIE